MTGKVGLDPLHRDPTSGVHNTPAVVMLRRRVGWRRRIFASMNLAKANPPIRVVIWWVGF